MGASWFVRPDTDRLSLSDGQWLLVKRRLSTGEFRAHLRRSSRIGDDGVRRLDLLEQGFSLVVAYLLDWSLDTVIRGVSEHDLVSALNALDPQRFTEIKQAIDTHEAAMIAEREEKKTIPSGATTSAPSSSSPSAPAPESPSTNSDVLM